MSKRNISSYGREQAILNKVLESPKGLVATFPSAKAAKGFQLNCYAFRALDRKKLSEGLDLLDPNRGSSPYDLIKLELKVQYKESTFQVIMRNCKTLMEVHGIDALLDLESGDAVEIETMPPLPTDDLPDLFDEDTAETESEDPNG